MIAELLKIDFSEYDDELGIGNITTLNSEVITEDSETVDNSTK